MAVPCIRRRITGRRMAVILDTVPAALAESVEWVESAV
jgi:hypothetical protein